MLYTDLTENITLLTEFKLNVRTDHLKTICSSFIAFETALHLIEDSFQAVKLLLVEFPIQH